MCFNENRIRAARPAWAPAENFPEGGKITDALKSRHVFGAPYKKSTIFRRAEGASENFRVICRTAAYDVIFSNSRGGASAPPCPFLRAPMHCFPIRAHAHAIGGCCRFDDKFKLLRRRPGWRHPVRCRRRHRRQMTSLALRRSPVRHQPFLHHRSVPPALV